MAPHDYTILGNWTATPPGLLVTLPGGHPGLNLGRLTSGPQPDWSLVSSLQQWRWREGGTRREANTASSIDLILHSYCCYSHLFFHISGLPFRVHQISFFCEFQKEEYGVCLPRVLEEEKKFFFFFCTTPQFTLAL